MTPEEIAKEKENINIMTHLQMARLWRFAKSGHPYFDNRNGDLYDYFKAKFDEKGGMTTAVSKAIGWD